MVIFLKTNLRVSVIAVLEKITFSTSFDSFYLIFGICQNSHQPL